MKTAEQELEELKQRLNDPKELEKMARERGVIKPEKKERQRPTVPTLSKDDYSKDEVNQILADFSKKMFDYVDSSLEAEFSERETKGKEKELETKKEKMKQEVQEFLAAHPGWKKLMPRIDQLFQRLGDIKEAYKLARLEKGLPAEEAEDEAEEVEEEDDDKGGEARTSRRGKKDEEEEEEDPTPRRRNPSRVSEDADPEDLRKKPRSTREAISLSLKEVSKKDPVLKELMAE